MLEIPVSLCGLPARNQCVGKELRPPKKVPNYVRYWATRINSRPITRRLHEHSGLAFRATFRPKRHGPGNTPSPSAILLKAKQTVYAHHLCGKPKASLPLQD
jgi:hypothetical protein